MDYTGGQECFSFSAPTSMGKTLVLREHIRLMIGSGNRCNYAVIVPSRALINENSRELVKSLESILHSEGYRIVENSGAAQGIEHELAVMVGIDHPS